jgi:hypothetical protein
MLWVPKTTSTQGALSSTASLSICAMQPPTAICMPSCGPCDSSDARGSVELAGGVVAHGAGVDHDDIGFGAGLGADVSALSSEPDSRSESWTFIWQPKVRTS